MTTPTLLALADRLDDYAQALNTSLLDGVIAELRAIAAPQVEMVSELPGLLEMSDLLRQVGVETKSFHDQQVAEAAYRAGYQAALASQAVGVKS